VADGTADRDAIDAIERALVRLRRSFSRRTLQRRSHPGAAPHTAALFAALDALEDTDGLSIGEIALAIGVDQPRASRLVSQAVASGLARRAPDALDRRRQNIVLTAAARRALADAHAARRDAVAQTLRGFTEEDANTLARLLSTFVARWPN
jgi:DNA-binding MarR family transcriptional regulator